MYNVTFDYPFNCRYYPMVASGSYDPKNKKCVQIFKPCDIEILKDHEWMQSKIGPSVQRKGKPEVKDKKVYRMYDFQSTHIQKLDEGRTTFTQIHLYALGGWITSKSLMKTIAKSRGLALLKDLVSNIKNTPEDAKLSELNKAPTFEEDGLARILYDLQIGQKDLEFASPKELKETKEEVKVEVEMKPILTEETIEEIIETIKEEVKDETKEVVEVSPEIQQEIKEEETKEVEPEIQQEIVKEVMEELNEETVVSSKEEINQETEMESKEEVKQEVEKETS
jgi:hypothetical protein